MSEDKKTTELQAVIDDSTAEFVIEDDAATRRISGDRFRPSQVAAVPGKNSTMPLPAVSGSKTMSAPVPEAVLQKIRAERQKEQETRTGAISGSTTTAEPPGIGSEDGADTVEENRRFKTLDIPMQAISLDETLRDDQPPAIRFEAEIGPGGDLVIPSKYEGLLRTGQRVTVTVEAILEPDS